MSSGYMGSMAPFSSCYGQDMRVHARAISAGFHPMSGPHSYNREWWERPDGVGLCVTYEELDEQIDLYRESWWTKAAANWRGE